MGALVGADRDRVLEAGKRAVGGLRQRLLDQRHIGAGAGGEIAGQVGFAPAFIDVDNQRRLGRGGTHRGDTRRIRARHCRRA